MQSELKFAGQSATIHQNQNQNSFPFNLPVEDYDKFSLYNPSQSEDFVIVPIHFYELFKGIAMEYINLQSGKHLLDSSLTIECWQ